MILNYNNIIAKLKDDLEQKKKATSQYETDWYHMIRNSSEKSLLLGQAKM